MITHLNIVNIAIKTVWRFTKFSVHINSFFDILGVCKHKNNKISKYNVLYSELLVRQLEKLMFTFVELMERM